MTMRLHLDFKGVPILYKTLNKRKEISVELGPSTCTMRELVDYLTKQFGLMVKKALLDPKGDIDMEIRVVLNQGTYLAEHRMGMVLKDGDSVAFLGAS